MIEDPALPVLRDLSPETLSRLSGTPGTTLLRLRYRRGQRGILHLSSRDGEGALWAFAGDKGRRIARRSPGARWDRETGAVFEPFPQDHRLPEIAALIRDWPKIAPALIGAEAREGLHLLRYRPGLSCTFRTSGADGRVCFVKVIGDDDVLALAAANAELLCRLKPDTVQIAPVVGTAPALRAIAYAGAEGRPLDQLLDAPHPDRAVGRTLAALDRLAGLSPVSPRIKDARALLATACAARDMVTTVFPSLAGLTADVMRRLDPIPQMALRQIHGDIKLEHVFLDRDRVTLIDTETMAIGPVAYDRAMLDGRLAMAVQSGLPDKAARPLRAQVMANPAPGLHWCRALVALRLAKFHAQHPRPGAEARAVEVLRDLP